MARQPSHTNAQIADMLERIADLLDGQEANPFRIRAYRDGARTVREHESPVADYIHKDELEALKALPNIGEGIAAVIGEYVSSGKSDLLETLESQASPADAFTRVPGIGKELAERVVEQLHIHTLPELEEAAHDGRLASVEGFGERRIEGVRAALAGMLSRAAGRDQRARTSKNTENGSSEKTKPSVALLLDIDADYRRRAEGDTLTKIAPRRFNPTNEAWLPIMHTERDGWKFTVLYSNTAKAHELGKTHDWVVIYYERDGKEQQNTVVTETKGSLIDKRVVRGREAETRQHYRQPVPA